MIVIDYAENDSLKENLSNIVKDEWIIKLWELYSIISKLDIMHQQKMIHYNFLHGNILNYSTDYILLISNLELYKPMRYFQSSSKKNNIYEVLPFMSPEVLKGKPYTSASDIFSFSMIMWEFVSGISPFDNRAHNFQFGLSIYKGERPEIIENTPQCYIDLMKKCWDENPLKRPESLEIKNIINDWISSINGKIVNEESINIAIEFYKADKALKKEQTNISNTSDLKSHLQKCYTNNFKSNEILDEDSNKNNQSIGNYYLL